MARDFCSDICLNCVSEALGGWEQVIKAGRLLTEKQRSVMQRVKGS